MAYNYRCSIRRRCGKSVTLNKKIDEYKKRPLCQACGRDTLKSVNSREKRRNKERVCNCDGYHYPHRICTEPWCKHSKREPTDEEYEQRHYEVMRSFK